MCRMANTKAYCTLIKSWDSAPNAVTESRCADGSGEISKSMVVEKSASSPKRAQYMIINPDGDVHRMHMLRDDHVP